MKFDWGFIDGRKIYSGLYFSSKFAKKIPDPVNGGWNFGTGRHPSPGNPVLPYPVFKIGCFTDQPAFFADAAVDREGETPRVSILRRR
mgnify:CR=1 FL=1